MQSVIWLHWNDEEENDQHTGWCEHTVNISHDLWSLKAILFDEQMKKTVAMIIVNDHRDCQCLMLTVIYSPLDTDWLTDWLTDAIDRREWN